MKIEIRKETRWDIVLYWTYVNDKFDRAFMDLEKAEQRFNDLKQNAQIPPVVEILKSEEV